MLLLGQLGKFLNNWMSYVTYRYQIGLIGVKMLDTTSEADFKLIYENIMKVMYKVAYNITREREIAEDMCHDCLIKMSEKKMTFPSLDDAKYWLIRVVRNASLNYVKRSSREKKAYQKIFKDSIKQTETNEDLLIKDEIVRQVQKAFNTLPENLRAVLQLKEYSDLNYKEIGAILGITEGNVKIRVFRARKKLLKILGENNVYLP